MLRLDPSWSTNGFQQLSATEIAAACATAGVECPSYLAAANDTTPVLVGPVAHYNKIAVSQSTLLGDALGASMDYLGSTTIDNEAVGVWVIHLHENTIHAYW